MFPIYIPTKDRVLRATTPRLLEKAGIPYTLVVEPQEAADYRTVFPEASLAILPAAHQGISFASNWVLKSERDKGNDWYWLMDDDITHLYTVEHTKYTRVTASILPEIEEKIAQMPEVGLASLEYQQYAWCAKGEYAWNGYCDDIVCVHAQRTQPFWYRYGLKQDRDFVLQLISSGIPTVRFTRYAFKVPKDGTNPGGLHEEYANQKHVEWSHRMVELWGPEICKVIVKKDGRVDARINWKAATKLAQVKSSI